MSTTAVRRVLTGAVLILGAAPATSLAGVQVELRPAAGAPGTSVALHGSGFARSGRIRVTAPGNRTRTVLASGAGTFTVHLTAPSRPSLLHLVSRSEARRVTNHFAVVPGAGRSTIVEVASAGGQRVRVSPLARSRGGGLRLRGRGFPAGERLRLSGPAGTQSVTADGRGRLVLTQAVPSVLAGSRSSLTISGGGVRLSVRVTLPTRRPAPSATAVAPTAEAAPPHSDAAQQASPAPAPVATATPVTPPAAGAGAPPPAPPTAPDPVVGAAGDIACDPSDGSFKAGNGTATACRQRYTAALISSWKPTAVLGLGDFQYETGTLAAYTAAYDRSWGRMKAITFPTPGNAHDQYGGGDYLRYWGAVRPEVRAAGAYRPYSFELGRWHVVSVPSGCVTGNTTVSCARGGPVETWLRNDLATHPSLCTLAIWHNPRWTSTTAKHGSFTETQPYWADAVAAHVDVVLSGDNHDYERFRPQDASGARDDISGVTQFVVGTGGKVLMPITRVIPNSAARDTADFGALKMTLHPASYDFQFVTESGAVKDAGTGVPCH